MQGSPEVQWFGNYYLDIMQDLVADHPAPAIQQLFDTMPTCIALPGIHREQLKIEGQVRDLTMMLLYLTRWTEDSVKKLPPGTKVGWRSWKRHEWEALDRLQEEGMVVFSYRAKSLGLTEEGDRDTRRLLKKYRLDMGENPRS